MARAAATGARSVATEYRLGFAGDIDLDRANGFRRRMTEIVGQKDFGALTILYSGEGGSTDQSIALYNFIKSLPVPVHMHGIGHIGSAAIPVFLAGAHRTCTSHARFLFHQYDWVFTEPQTLHGIDEAVQRLKSDIELARTIIQSQTDVPDDILKTLDGRAAPVILTPDRAKAFRVVEKVCELGQTGRNGMKVAVWTV